jgi:Predicted sugar phosphatases of the HAD superfamily
MHPAGVVFDIDGTVLRGSDPLPGAVETIEACRHAEIPVRFVTNNPTQPPETYVDRFASAGIEVRAEEVLTAGAATARLLRRDHADAAIGVIGADSLREQLRVADLEVRSLSDPVDVLVVSIDHDFHYDTLVRAQALLADSTVAFVGTDPDMVIPAAAGARPGSGAIIHAVAGVTGRDPTVICGKPSEMMQSMVLEAFEAPPASLLVVGDRLDTDIALGAAAGMQTAHVTTGVASQAPEGITPDRTIDRLDALTAGW